MDKNQCPVEGWHYGGVIRPLAFPVKTRVKSPGLFFLEIMQKALDYRCVPSILLTDRRAKAQGRRRRTMKKENRDALLFVALEILVGLASLVGWYLGDLVNNLLH